MPDPNDTTNNQAAEGMKKPAAAPAPAPAVDLQAEINKALLSQQAQHESELKEVTGHSSLKSLKEAQLAEQGKTQELLDAKSSELSVVTKRFHTSQINAALLSAAADAVDPGTIAELLAVKGVCDDEGNVTVDGQSAADAVKALLEAKPFLAKAQGDAGSGAPISTQGANSLTRAAFDALDPAAKAQFAADGGNVTE